MQHKFSNGSKRLLVAGFITALAHGCGDAGAGSYGALSYAPTSAVAAVEDPDDSVESPAATESWSTSPYVMTDHDPFSTFAADVDTASYDILRRAVQDGVLPEESTVRLEEYVNYFDYDYPAPAADAEVPFAIDLAAAPSLIDNGTTVLRVGIQATKPPPEEKKPANLVFLIDRSGSMSDSDKLPLVQQVLSQTLDLLDPSDTISIVTYASGTGVALPPTPASDTATIRSAIWSLEAGGSTNGAGGIQLAYQQAEQAFIEEGINHVVLCTDGDFNVGVASTTELVDLIEEKRRAGVTLTALGFGYGNLNDAMMEAVSNAGNGQYGVISSEDHATKYVRERMLSTLVLVAKDMKIQVELNADQVLAYRLLGYENRAIADVDFRNDIVDAGEVGAGHRVTALYELVLAEGRIPQVDGAPAPLDGAPSALAREIDAEDLVLVKVRYKDVGATEDDPAYEVASSLSPADIATHHTQLDDDFQWAIAVGAFAEILSGSPYGSLGLLDTIEAITTAQRSRDDDRAEFVRLLEQTRASLGR